MAEQEEAVERAKMDIVTLKRQDEDLDILFKRIYEDSVTEQKELRKKTGELQYLIDNEKQEIYDFRMNMCLIAFFTNRSQNVVGRGLLGHMFFSSFVYTT